MKFIANLLTKATVNAFFIVDFGVKKAFTVGIHCYAMLGTDGKTGTAAAAFMFVGNVYHLLILNNLRLLYRKNTLSCLVNPMKYELAPTERTQVKPTASNLSQPSAHCMRTTRGRIMAMATVLIIGI